MATEEFDSLDDDLAPEAESEQTEDVSSSTLEETQLVQPIVTSQNSEDKIEDAQVGTIEHLSNFSDTAERIERLRPRRHAEFMESEGPHKKALFPALVALGIVVFIVFATAMGTYAAELWGGKTIPNVIGLPPAAATQKLEEKGFVVEQTQEAVDDGVDHVVKISPEAGKREEPGTKVTIVVGVARNVPEVLGLSLDEAKAALKEAGADKVDVELVNSDETENTVLAVDPPVGKRFTSRDGIKLKVAQPFTVPYIVNKTEAEAVQIIENAQLVAKVEYVSVDDEKQNGKVLDSEPKQGERIKSKGTVTLKVASSAPKDFKLFLDYFKRPAKSLDSFLSKQGFSLVAASANSENLAEALYKKGDAYLAFTSTPFAYQFQGGSSVVQQVMSENLGFNGLRYDLAAGERPANSANSLTSLASSYGLGSISVTYTKESLPLPADIDRESAAPFNFGYGESGDLCYSVFVNDSRASITVAKKDLYSAYNVSNYGGSIASLIAYSEAYVQ